MYHTIHSMQIRTCQPIRVCTVTDLLALSLAVVMPDLAVMLPRLLEPKLLLRLREVLEVLGISCAAGDATPRFDTVPDRLRLGWALLGEGEGMREEGCKHDTSICVVLPMAVSNSSLRTDP